MHMHARREKLYGDTTNETDSFGKVLIYRKSIVNPYFSAEKRVGFFLLIFFI